MKNAKYYTLDGYGFQCLWCLIKQIDMLVTKWLEGCVKSKQHTPTSEWQSGYQNALVDILFLLDQAVEMEKEQIERAHIDGGKNKRTAVKYYNETFKSE